MSAMSVPVRTSTLNGTETCLNTISAACQEDLGMSLWSGQSALIVRI